MFFYLSKILWPLVKPMTFIACLALFGLIIRPWKRVAGRRILMFSLSLFLIFGFLPIGHNMMVFLETRHSRPDPMPANIDGIIVLGGAFQSVTTEQTGMMATNSSLMRLIDFVDLARKHPKARLIFSGGAGKILHPEKKETEDAAHFFDMIGMDTSRIMYEANSRNSYENIKFSKEFAAPLASENWVVITSAFHMPRVMGIFEQQGWNVTPYPSSPKTNGRYKFSPFPLDPLGNFSALHTATKELIGAIAYYFSGKSAFLLPRTPLEFRDSQNKDNAGTGSQ